MAHLIEALTWSRGRFLDERLPPLKATSDVWLVVEKNLPRRFSFLRQEHGGPGRCVAAPATATRPARSGASNLVAFLPCVDQGQRFAMLAATIGRSPERWARLGRDTPIAA